MMEVPTEVIKVLGDQYEKIVEIGEKYGWGRGKGHAFKVAQLTSDLWTSAEKAGLVRDDVNLRKALYTAALLHDIGIKRGGEHHEVSAEIIKKEVGNIEPNLADRSSVIAYHHRSKTNPMEDIRVNRDRDMLLAIALLRIADALDYQLDQRVRHAAITVREDKVVIEVHCGLNDYISFDIERVRKKKSLLEQLIGRGVEIEERRQS